MQTLNTSWRKVFSFSVALTATVAVLACSAYSQPPEQPPQPQQPPAPGGGDGSIASLNEPVVRITSKTSDLKLIEEFSKVVEMGVKITRVDGFDPEVVNVTALDPFRIRVQALTPGVTTMALFDEQGQVYTVELFVVGDVRHLQAYIDKLFPHSAVKAVAIREGVVLRGWVTKPENITHLVEIARMFYPQVLNQIVVGGLQQVQLKVRILEMQRGKIRRLGMNFLYMNQDGYLASTPGSLTPLSGIIAPFGGPPGLTFSPARFADSTISGGFLGEEHIFQGFLQALKEEALLKILAEPKLVTTNGRPANMLAGGEFPVLVPQSLGTTTIEWREFGVRLEAVPIILGNGRVRLELQPEVSERDFANAVDINGFTVPGLTTRRVNTQVEMRFGETFMLAGLLAMRNTAETDKLPILGELPYIGAAFRRMRYDESETELVIMVTPELVAPMSEEQVPPGGPGQFTTTPTDRELYLGGLVEVPNYGDACIGCDRVAPSVILHSESETIYQPPSAVNDGLTPSASPQSSLPAFVPPVPGDGTTSHQQSPQGGPRIGPAETTIDLGGRMSRTGIPAQSTRSPFWRRARGMFRNPLNRSKVQHAGNVEAPTPGAKAPTVRPATSTGIQNNRIPTRGAEDTRNSDLSTSQQFRPGLISPRPGLIKPGTTN